MRAHGDILLISCYELGRQPLGLATTAAFLERAGFSPATLDISVEPLDDARLAAAKLIAISVPMHTAMRLGVRVAARAREVAPHAHICFYGLYATLNATWVLEGALNAAPPRTPVADSVSGGEYEPALVRLAESLEDGHGEGLANAAAGIARKGHPALPVLTRPDFPPPSRGQLPALDRYAKIEIDGKTALAGAVEASRGCLHMCTHCPIPPVYGGRFIAVPAEIVLVDVDRLVEAGATHVTFADPDFLNGPSHSRRIVAEMHARHPALTWDFTAKVEHLLSHRELLPEFRAAGCLFVVTAVESLSERVLGILRKGHTRADVDTALALVREAGIAFRPSLLPFTPWSALEDYRELLAWVVDRDLVDQVDPVQLTIRLLVPPGSLLESDPSMTPHLRALEPETLRWTWTHPDPRMDELHREAVAIVAAGTLANQDASAMFERLAQAGPLRTAPGSVERPVAGAKARRPRAPRLTEPWFC